MTQCKTITLTVSTLLRHENLDALRATSGDGAKKQTYATKVAVKAGESELRARRN